MPTLPPLRRAPPLACVGAALLASLCSTRAAAFDLLKYFPTPQGARWEYRYSESSSTRVCTGLRVLSIPNASEDTVTLVTATPEADKCAKAAATIGFPPATETLNVSLSAFRLVSRDAAGAITPNSMAWQAPLLFLPTFSNVYQSYGSEGTLNERRGSEERTAAYSATLKLIGIEDVNVPAGKFPATLHVQLIERRTYPPPLGTRVVTRTDRWLVRDLGAVRVRVEVLIDERRVENGQLQLERAQLPDAPVDQ